MTSKASLDPELDMLSATIFANRDIAHTLELVMLHDFADVFESKTRGYAGTTLLSPRVFRMTFYYSGNHPRPWILRHDPEIVKLEARYSLELVLHCYPSEYNGKPYLPVTLAVFDLDSTLINEEVIDELARSVDVEDKVAAITERAMAGELDFERSLRERVLLLKGTKADVWETLKRSITFANGARELCRALKRLGCEMAVISGGFVEMAEWVKNELMLDHAYANKISTCEFMPPHDYKHLTGYLEPEHPIITARAKRELTHKIAEIKGLSLRHALCVGDGANDLEMLSAVGEGGGLGVAFKAKPKVQLLAPNRLNRRSLTDLLYLFGYTEANIEKLTGVWYPSITIPPSRPISYTFDYLHTYTTIHFGARPKKNIVRRRSDGVITQLDGLPISTKQIELLSSPVLEAIENPPASQDELPLRPELEKVRTIKRYLCCRDGLVKWLDDEEISTASEILPLVAGKRMGQVPHAVPQVKSGIDAKLPIWLVASDPAIETRNASDEARASSQTPDHASTYREDSVTAA